MNKTLYAIIGILIVIALGIAATQLTGLSAQPIQSTGTTATLPVATTTPLTMSDVAKHADASSCYAAINGNVYDLTSWIDQHPGGPDKILSICGKDGTSAFEAQHGGQRRPESELANFKIGTLAQ